MQVTTFVFNRTLAIVLQSEPEPQTQINVAAPAPASYGAVEHVSNNPFAFSAGTILEESVQPDAD